MASTRMLVALLGVFLATSIGSLGAGQFSTERLSVNESRVLDANVNYGLGGSFTRTMRLDVSVDTTNPVDVVFSHWLADRPRPSDSNQTVVFSRHSTTAEHFAVEVPPGMFWFLDLNHLSQNPNSIHLRILEVNEQTRTTLLALGTFLGGGGAIAGFALVWVQRRVPQTAGGKPERDNSP